MQQINSITAATTTAIANARIGSAAVVTNAAAAYFPGFSYSVSKCSDPSKSGMGMLERWRGHELPRAGRPSTPPVAGHHPTHDGVVVSSVTSTACAVPSTTQLPPGVWASLVLGRSLCG